MLPLRVSLHYTLYSPPKESQSSSSSPLGDQRACRTILDWITTRDTCSPLLMYYPIYLPCCRDLLFFFALTHSMSVVIRIESDALWVIIPPNAHYTYFPCRRISHPAASIILYDCPRLIAIRPASSVARHARLPQVAVQCSVSHCNYHKLDTCDVALRSDACPVRRAPR